MVVIDEFHHAEAGRIANILDHLHPKNCWASPRRQSAPTASDVRSRTSGVGLQRSFGCGMPLALISSARSTTSSSPTAQTCEASRGAGTVRRGGALERLHRQRRPRCASFSASSATRCSDVSAMRALGFCVSVAHADYMADVFTTAGIPHAPSVVQTLRQERDQALADLRARRVNILFAADLFNEGLDLPEVDTVLFLRPTESATVFLQQLGRGLRRTRDKAVLTVLDFVGYHRKEFNFGRKLRALTGQTRAGVERDMTEGFPFLPSGCQIVIDQTWRDDRCDNIRSQVANRWPQIVAELRSYGDYDLSNFPGESGMELSESCARGTLLDATAPRRGARTCGVRTRGEASQASARFAHVDDRHAPKLRPTLADDAPTYGDLTEGMSNEWPEWSSFPVARRRWLRSRPGGARTLPSEAAMRDELVDGH